MLSSEEEYTVLGVPSTQCTHVGLDQHKTVELLENVSVSDVTMCRDSGSARKSARPKRKVAAASMKEASSDAEDDSSADEGEEEADEDIDDATPGPSGRHAAGGTAANRSCPSPSELIIQNLETPE
jgi:hypothetical protein